MREIRGDMWKVATEDKFDAVVITTNGFVKANGEAVMGRGCAKQAAQMFPGINLELGKIIKQFGNRVYPIKSTREYDIVAFPVKPITTYAARDIGNVVKHMQAQFKPGDRVPGWAAVADTRIIEKSAQQLAELAEFHGWQRVIMPRPGCGAGELEWEIIKPILQKYLDDRFYVITY